MTEDESWAELPPGEPIEGKTYRKDGWVYRDMPRKFTHEAWDLFISILGPENYVILAESKSTTWRRGQFLISPQGIKNLQAYAQEIKSNVYGKSK